MASDTYIHKTRLGDQRRTARRLPSATSWRELARLCNEFPQWETRLTKRFMRHQQARAQRRRDARSRGLTKSIPTAPDND